MEKTWRWFGRNDQITLDALREIGVEGIVTALHDIPNGDVWTEEKIKEMKDYIESHGLRWSVVESLPVSEEIKYAGPGRDRLIANYIESLRNLGRQGIHTVCYNFMPVIDWLRTDLRYEVGKGIYSLYFDWVHYAYFDIKVLGREGAEKDYSPELLAKVEEYAANITDKEKENLIESIVIKTQDFVNGPLGYGAGTPVERFKALMRPYDGMTKDQLRENLRYFLEAVMPVCREYDIRMCIHPDDPPMQVFGMPRICGCAEDIRWILDCVPDFHNGLTFCCGSLSAGAHNDIVAMAREFAPRVHFAHIRKCKIFPGGNFVEDSHISPDGPDLFEIVKTFESEPRCIPMRVDHAYDILGDEDRGYHPGYGFHGRMLALGEVSGMMAAFKSMR